MSVKKGVVLLSILMALALTLAQPAAAGPISYQKAIGGGYVEASDCPSDSPKASFGFKVMNDKNGYKGEFQLSDVTCANDNPCFDIHVKEISYIFVDGNYCYFEGPADDGQNYVEVWAWDNSQFSSPDYISIAVYDSLASPICEYLDLEVLGDISVKSK